MTEEDTCHGHLTRGQKGKEKHPVEMEESQKKKNHCIFRCLCLNYPWPLLDRSQGSVITQTSCKVRCLSSAMFIAGAVKWPQEGFFPYVYA